MPFPDYQGRSIVNLMASITHRLGGASAYPPLAVEGVIETDHSQLVLLIVDGLGYDYLMGSSGWLRHHCASRLTSVFPSTTATSISTFLTGQAPQQHGITGWFTYFEEIDEVIAVLPCQQRGQRDVDTETDYAALYGHAPIFDKFDVPSYVVSPNWILNTTFNRMHAGRATPLGYETLSGLFENLAQLLANRSPKYVYAYWPEFDHLSHVHGNGSQQVTDHFHQLGEQIDRFLTTVRGTGTLLLITADHGFIDTHPQRMITLNQHPVLLDCLRQPLCGEPRAAFCYVHPDKRDTFAEYVDHHFSHQLTLHESESLLNQGVFGPGQAHPALHRRIGDFTLVMQENFVIKDWLEGESPFFHHGVHGGISEQEMYVPLVMIET